MASKRNTSDNSPSQAVSVANSEALPASMEDLAVLDAGAGLESAKSRDDFAIPFVSVLQSLSPQLDPTSPDYLEDARAGMIYNSVTKTVSDSVRVIVGYYNRTFIEWVPRTAGGGFRGESTERQEEYDKLRDPTTGKAKLHSGNELADTRNFYVLTLSPNGSIAPAMISMGSTQIKRAKLWVANLRTPYPKRDGSGVFVPPAWAHLWKLTSVPESNAKGRWFSWRIEREGFVQEAALYGAGSAFRAQIGSGLIAVDRSQQQPEPAHEDGNTL